MSVLCGEIDKLLVTHWRAGRILLAGQRWNQAENHAANDLKNTFHFRFPPHGKLDAARRHLDVSETEFGRPV